MDINIKDTLKKLRQDKGTTQEQLAAHLGISPQAISKWERGEGLPDITLLPALALYFGISVDDLLGVGEAKIKEKVEEYKNESHRLGHIGESRKNYELWEKAYAEFPNNEEVMYHRMYALDEMTHQTEGEEKKKVTDETIKTGNRLITSPNSNHRIGAIQVLAYVYDNMGDTEKAKEYAMMAGNVWISSNVLLRTILKGEERAEQCQNNVMQLADIMTMDASLLCGCGNYSHKEQAEIYRFNLNLLHMVFPNGDFGFYACRMADYSHDLAVELLHDGDIEGTLSAIEEAADFAVNYDTQPDFDRTSILVNRTKHKRNSSSTNHTENHCALMLDNLNGGIFDPIRDTPRFKAVTEKLREYAKWENE